MPEARRLDATHRLDHADVAGDLQHRGEINHPIPLAVVVEDRPAANGELTGVIHLAGGINGVFLQGDRQVDRFEGGARFVEVLDRPFPEEPGLVIPELVGVVGRCGGCLLYTSPSPRDS